MASRAADAVASAIDRVAAVADRLMGAEAKLPAEAAAEVIVETVAAVVDDGTGAEQELLDDFPNVEPDDGFDEPPDLDDMRERFVDSLGPILEEGPDDRDLDDIELDQWRAFFDEYEEQLPEGFIDDLFAHIESEYDLDDEWLSVCEMDAPDDDDNYGVGAS